ncbi:MAG: ABC transporter ATP-binding protein [Thermodesulfobacteriota bacterium]
MAFVEARDVSFGYQPQDPVLSAINLTGEKGGLYVCIGPNGAGKSTLLALLAGWLTPETGSVCLEEANIARMGQRRLAQRVAVVEQEHAVLPHLRVEQVVLLGRAPFLGWLRWEGRRDRDLAREAMAFTHVEHLAARRLGELSGGERQRVHLARALCQQPQLLLLDEPTASLDPAHQVRIMDLLQRLCREQGLCVCLVSHDLNLAALYADHVLLLQNGRLLGQGPPNEVMTFALLEQAYGCVMLVEQSRLGVPVVTPVPQRYLGGN